MSARKTSPVSPDDAARLLRSIEAIMFKFRVSEARQTQSSRYLKYSPVAFQTLRWLFATNRPTPSALARFLDVPPATVTSLLNRLETQGLVERTASTRDRRKLNLGLTSRGQRAVAAIASEDRANCTDILKILDSQPRAELLNHLEGIAASINAERSAGNKPNVSSKSPRNKRPPKQKPGPINPLETSSGDKMATERIKRDRRTRPWSKF